jgi:hypothetical protein
MRSSPAISELAKKMATDYSGLSASSALASIQRARPGRRGGLMVRSWE